MSHLNTPNVADAKFTAFTGVDSLDANGPYGDGTPGAVPVNLCAGQNIANPLQNEILNLIRLVNSVNTIKVKNSTGSTLTTVSACALSGYDSGVGVFTASLANVGASLPAWGFPQSAIADGETGWLQQACPAVTVDTSGHSTGDLLYLVANGTGLSGGNIGFTAGALPQPLGVVTGASSVALVRGQAIGSPNVFAAETLVSSNDTSNTDLSSINIVFGAFFYPIKFTSLTLTITAAGAYSFDLILAWSGSTVWTQAVSGIGDGTPHDTVIALVSTVVVTNGAYGGYVFSVDNLVGSPVFAFSTALGYSKYTLLGRVCIGLG